MILNIADISMISNADIKNATVKECMIGNIAYLYLRTYKTVAYINELKFIENQPRGDQQPWMFYVWGHAYEFVRDDNWHIIEEFAEKVGGKEDIWYATNMEIWEYTENFKRLVFSLDERYVYNPTAQTMYFLLNRKLYAVAPGQTVKTEV